MKLAAIALATTLASGLCTTAFADRLTIDATVTSVVSDAGSRTRAIAGEDRGGYLVLERISDRGGASDQVWVDELPLGRSSVPLTELKNIRLLSIENKTLQFEANPRTKGGNRMTIACTANLEYSRGKVQITRANCTSGGQPYAPELASGPTQQPPPPPAAVSTKQLAALADACDSTFSFDSERKKCLDMSVEATKSGQFPASTGRVVSACATAFSFGSTRFSCMQSAFVSVREPAELISWCAGKFNFESERQSCISKYTATR
ncbi:hypothetical protein BH11MYX2_BH11MYX2_36610 [soil metagenome]